jgi:predicted site-specific integrase-resolvase
VSDLINTKQAAERLGKSPGTVTRLVRLGRLAPVLRGTGRTGSMWFDPEDIDAFAEAS